MRQIYEDFVNGEPLTDEELEQGIAFFRDLTVKLSALGPVFELATKEARRVLFQFENFRKARQAKGAHDEQSRV